MYRYIFSFLLLLVLSCDEDERSGCTDPTACNYDLNALINDDSCEYAEANFDCDGNCLVDIDCEGVCGGNAIADECGECNGDGPEACLL